MGCGSETVVVVEAERLVVTPAEHTLIEGETANWTATLLSAEGDALTGRNIVWSSGDPSVLQPAGTVGSPLAVEAVGAGSTTLRASAEGHVAIANVVVLPGPSIALSSSTLSIQGRQGEQAPPVDVDITNGGNGPLSGLSTRIIYPDDGAAGWLSVGLNGTTAPTSMTVNASAVALQPGLYKAGVQVASPSGGGLTAALPIEFEVMPPPPIILLESQAVGLSSSFLNPIPASADVGVTNGGAGVLDDLSVSIEYSSGDSGGWLTATLEATEAPTTLRVSAVAVGLRPGDYAARVAVAAPGASETPVYLNVTFRVASPDYSARPAEGSRP